MAPDLAGTRLGDFEVRRELGRGGMGVVYEARQLSLNRPVALKVLSAGLSPRAVARFRREAETAARLHHTNIVPVYATGEERGAHFYAMELVEGPSLDRVLKDLASRGGAAPDPTGHGLTGPYVEPSALTPTGSPAAGSGLSSGTAYFDAVARMVADVADALDYAHRQGVLHRDVKPANLLLAPGGRLTVNDFGLARLLEEPGMTATGEFVGTPAYMSPEQVAGGRIPVDHRTDIYSLGATLYELLTLRPPFRADGRDRLLAMVVQKDPDRPRAVNPRVPVDLETICLKCLEKDPDRRYPSAKDLADDLRRYVSRFAIAARRTGPIGRLKKWARRNPGLTAVGAGLVLALAGAGGLGYRAVVVDRQRAADRDRHAAELREERWRAALDRAHLAALTGDVAGAEDGIREADELGASAGQLHLLRGLVAYGRGQAAEAIGHLEQAAGLMPESVAAHSLLAAAFAQRSEWRRHHDALRVAEGLTAVTPEDHLFRGSVRALHDPAAAVPALDEAARGRPASPVVRVARAEARMNLVLDRPSPEEAAIAEADGALAVRLTGGSPLAHRVSLLAHLAAANAYRERGLADRATAALAAADRDAAALAPLTRRVEAVEARWLYFREVGREAEMIPELEATHADTREPILACFLAEAHYRAGRFDRAAAALEAHRDQALPALHAALALAEGPGGRAAGVTRVRDLLGRDPAGWERFNALCLLRLLGEGPEAAAGARDLRRQPHLFPPVGERPFVRAVDHAAGFLTDDALLRAAATRTEACNAHFCAGIARLAAGDRAAARDHFRAGTDTHVFLVFPYDLCLLLASRMDRDPAWPPWVPAAR